MFRPSLHALGLATFSVVPIDDWSYSVELINQFEVGVPVERAWEVFTDLEVVTPCLPGARLTEAEGDDYFGTIKVKVGSVTASYVGKIRFVEQDREAGRLVLAAEGKDARGRGTATATIKAEFTPSDAGTAVLMTTDMTVTGMVAQFGRAIMVDVSRKLIGEFAKRLEQRITGDDATPDGADSRAEDPAPTAVRRIESSEAAPFDLGGAAAGALTKRVAWIAGGAITLVVALLLIRAVS